MTIFLSVVCGTLAAVVFLVVRDLRTLIRHVEDTETALKKLAGQVQYMDNELGRVRAKVEGRTDA